MFSGIDAGLVRSLARFDGGQDPLTLLAAALISRAASEGHVCIDLSRLAEQPIAGSDHPERGPACPPLVPWLEKLQASPLVGAPGQWRPLILDRQHFIYLQHFHQDEQDIAEHLKARSKRTGPPVSTADFRRLLMRYFPGQRPEETDWQKVAVIIALMRRLCIISGAPGTGKTTTVAKIIGLLIDIHHPQPLRFALCAPTGKAAARLSEALTTAVGNLPCRSETRTRFPTQASTIHRLLGFGRNRFRFNATNPLPADVVVIDEASMVDLSLMARLLEDIPPPARLIILGDRNQLSSVEAGSVMGEICEGARPEILAGDLLDVFRQTAPFVRPVGATAPSDASPLSDNVVILERNYRFDAEQGIGALVRAVNQGKVQTVRKLLSGPEPEIQWIETPMGEPDRRKLRETIVEGYRPVFEADTVDRALIALDRFMVLCALVGGPWGTDRLNRWIETLLKREGWIESRNRWYRGRPVMIRRNDYRTRLFNGDVGIVWPDHDGRESGARVWFRMPTGQLRGFNPQQLPEHQTALALTVHKSQGSEYRRIVLALPEQDSPILTRELLYTGLSRARHRILLVAGESVLDLTLNRRVDRTSGLKEALARP